MSHPGRTLESFFKPHEVLAGREWVTQALTIGREASIRPPDRTLKDRLDSLDWRTPELEIELGIDKLRQQEDLASLFEVAGDGDGHRFYLSAASGQFYVWWRFGPERVVPCALQGEHFVDWMVEQYPEQPRERPWTTFKTSEPFHVTGFCYAHSIQFPLSDLAAMTLPLFRQPICYRTSNSYSVIDPDVPLLIEAFHHHRGFHTMLHLEVNKAAASDRVWVEKSLTFQKAVLDQGFCEPDSPELVRAC